MLRQLFQFCTAADNVEGRCPQIRTPACGSDILHKVLPMVILSNYFTYGTKPAFRFDTTSLDESSVFGRAGKLFFFVARCLGSNLHCHDDWRQRSRIVSAGNP